MTKKYIIEYLAGTKGDMLCRFLNNIKPNLESTGKSKPVVSSVPSWLKVMDPQELTLERFEEALSVNPYEYMPAHPLWVVHNPKYLDLIEKYNYEICSLKFEPEHYVTVVIEALIKNMPNLAKNDKSNAPEIHLINHPNSLRASSLYGAPRVNLLTVNRDYIEAGFPHLSRSRITSTLGTFPNNNPEIQVTELLNILFFEDKFIPKWLDKAMSDVGIVLKDLDLSKDNLDLRMQNIVKNPPNHLYKRRSLVSRLFNEMTEHRTILNYEDLYLGGYPFPDLPDREEEWKNLVENSWCDYDRNGYRKFVLPDKPLEPTNKITKIITEYLEQWKK
jgi:hypothetical protein